MNPAVAQSLPIISLVVAGFLLKQVGLIRPGDGQVMARIIVNTTLPAVIFLSVARANVTPERLAVLALCGIVISLGLRVAAGWCVSRLKLERRVAGVVVLAAMVINVGFFLFPIFQTVYGQEGISRLAAFDLGNSLMANSYGYYLASCYGDKPPWGFQHSLKRVLVSPGSVGRSSRPGGQPERGAVAVFPGQAPRTLGRSQHSTGDAHPRLVLATPLPRTGNPWRLPSRCAWG